MDGHESPYMIMMVGLPGSGKSTLANIMTVYKADGMYDYHPTVISSDAIREELYGDAADQNHNDKVFRVLHQRIRDTLRAGNNVIFDATNIKKKERVHFLKSLHGVECIPECFVVATPVEECIARNQKRKRVVPDRVIRRMLRQYQPPAQNEGFERISYVFPDEFDHAYPGWTVADFDHQAATFDQRNHHHSCTLGAHCILTTEWLVDRGVKDNRLLFAAHIHDNGKLWTATPTNKRGESDGNWHYYNHENVGAYNSMFYARSAGFFHYNDLTYIANIIYYHMRPYTAWKSSEKAYQRDLALCGDAFIRDVALLHEADVASH